MSWWDDLQGNAPPAYDTNQFQDPSGGWLASLVGQSPTGGGFENWLRAPDWNIALPDFSALQAGGEKLSHLITPYQYEGAPQVEDLSGVMDIYHGLMSPFGAGKRLVDTGIGALADNTPFEATKPGNESGQFMWEALRNEPNVASLRAASDMLGTSQFTDTLGAGGMGMLADPTTYALPSAPGALFAPGMAEQIWEGLKKGGQEGAAEALLGVGGLAAVGSHFAPEIGAGINKVRETLPRVTERLPFQYDPTTVGVGLGGFGEGTPKLSDKALAEKIGKKIDTPIDPVGDEKILEAITAREAGQPIDITEVLGNRNLPKVDPNIVYHGTPHDFENFDLSKIGTGEGSQAFGHGFYFAENPKVAHGYGENVTGKLPAVSVDVAREAMRNYETKSDAIASIEKEIKKKEAMIDGRKELTGDKFDKWTSLFEIDVEQFKDAIEHIKNDTYHPTKTLLAAEIPQPDKFIDYDKPIGQQDPNIEAKVPGIQRARRFEDNLTKSVHDIEGSLNGINKLGIDVRELQDGIRDYNSGNKEALAKVVDEMGNIARKVSIGRYPMDIATQVRNLYEGISRDWTAVRPEGSVRSIVEDRNFDTQEMAKEGVKGVKYLDRASRGGGEGTRNYVVFDPTDINIIGKKTNVPKEALAEFVKEMKDKYGEKNWRKGMDSGEKKEFETAQLKAVEAPAAPVEKVVPKIPETTTLYRGNRPGTEGGQWFTQNEKLAKLYAEGNEPLVSIEVPTADLPKYLPENPEYIVKPGMESKYGEYKIPNELASTAKPKLKIEEVPLKEATSTGGEPPNTGELATFKGESKEPPVPPKELESLSKFERAAYSTERNVAKANPEIGAAEKAYRLEHETQASKAIGEITEATKGVDKASENRIIRYMDGEPIVLKPSELTVANKLRRILDRVAEGAADEGVLTGYRKNYFTHINEKVGEAKAETYFGKDKLGDKPYGPLEKTRTSSNPNIVRSFDVIKQYADKATRRIAEAKFLGKDLSNVRSIGDVETVKYVQNYIKQITNRGEKAGPVSKALGTLRHAAALGDLTFTSILQVGQGVHTAAYTGFRRAASAAFEVLRDYKKADLAALKSGALYPAISHEVGIAVGNKGYMHGVPTADRAMRVHAFVAGRMLLEDAKKGNSYAKRLVSELGIKDLNDPSSLALAGKLVSDKTQLRSDISHLPAWFKTDAGKMATQYLNFAYANTKFISDMFRHPVKNLGQISRFAIMGAIAGEGISDFREAVKSLVPGKSEDEDALRRMLDAMEGDEDFDSKSFFEKLTAVTRNKKIPLDSPAWRMLQNLAGIGAGTIFQTLVEKVGQGDFKSIPLGPAGGLAAEAGTSIYGDVKKSLEDEEVTAEKTGRTVLKNLPIPFVSGYKVADYVLPKATSGSGRFKVSPPKFHLPKVKVGS